MRVRGQSREGEFRIPWGRIGSHGTRGGWARGFQMPASAWGKHCKKSPRQLTLHGLIPFLDISGGGWQGTLGMPGWVGSPGPWPAATVLSLPIPSGQPRTGAAVPALGPR